MLVFDDEVEVRLWVERVGSSSITYRWEVTKDGETAIDGTHTVVRVGSDGRPRPVSGEVRALLEGYEAAGVGFEPTEPCGSAVFKTAPFDRSGTPPGGSVYAPVDTAIAARFRPFRHEGSTPRRRRWSSVAGVRAPSNCVLNGDSESPEESVDDEVDLIVPQMREEREGDQPRRRRHR